MTRSVACGECGDWHARDDESCPIVQDQWRERAMLARIGGNVARRRYAGVQHTHPGIFQDARRMALMDDEIRSTAESLAANRSHLTGNYWRGGPSPADPARFWDLDHRAWPRTFEVRLPEAAFDWPIYRAATGRLLELAIDPRTAP